MRREGGEGELLNVFKLSNWDLFPLSPVSYCESSPGWIWTVSSQCLLHVSPPEGGVYWGHVSPLHTYGPDISSFDTLSTLQLVIVFTDLDFPPWNTNTSLSAWQNYIHNNLRHTQLETNRNIWSLGPLKQPNLSHVFQSLGVGQQLPDQPPRLLGGVVQRGGRLASEQVDRGQEVVRTLATLKFL